MRKKTEIELQQDRIIKTVRSLIRLKHSLDADREINDVLFDKLNEFEDSLQGGTLKEIASPLTAFEELSAAMEKVKNGI